MAVTNLGRVYQSSINEDIDFESGRVTKSYSVAYLVRVTDDCNDEAQVVNAPGLPQLGEASLVHPGCYVANRSASESEEGGIWTVTYTYNTPEKGEAGGGGGGGGGGGDGSPGKIADKDIAPWLLPSKYSFSTARKQSLKSWMIYLGAYEEEIGDAPNPQVFPWQKEAGRKKDAFGNLVIPVTNAVGEPIYYDGERIVGIQTRKFATTFNPIGGDRSLYERYTKYVGTLNGAQETHRFFIAKPGQALLDDVTYDENFWTSPVTGIVYSYYDVTLKIAYDPLGHWVEFANIGSMFFPPAVTMSGGSGLEDAIIAKDKDGNPTMVELGPSGYKAAPGTHTFLRYSPFPYVGVDRELSL